MDSLKNKRQYTNKCCLNVPDFTASDAKLYYLTPADLIISQNITCTILFDKDFCFFSVIWF